MDLDARIKACAAKHGIGWNYVEALSKPYDRCKKCFTEDCCARDGCWYGRDDDTHDTFKPPPPGPIGPDQWW